MQSHSYLSMYPLYLWILEDMIQKYSLRKLTSDSGENFSLKPVNHSISEKNIVTFFFSPLRFISHFFESTAFAISLSTYSDKALFNSLLSSRLRRYQIIFTINTQLNANSTRKVSLSISNINALFSIS